MSSYIVSFTPAFFPSGEHLTGSISCEARVSFQPHYVLTREGKRILENGANCGILRGEAGL